MPNIGNYLLIKTHWIKGIYLIKHDVVLCSKMKSSYWQLQAIADEKVDFEAMILTAKHINSTCELEKRGKLAVRTRGVLIKRQLFILTYNHLILFKQLCRFKIKASGGRI